MTDVATASGDHPRFSYRPTQVVTSVADITV